MEHRDKKQKKDYESIIQELKIDNAALASENEALKIYIRELQTETNGDRNTSQINDRIKERPGDQQSGVVKEHIIEINPQEVLEVKSILELENNNKRLEVLTSNLNIENGKSHDDKKRSTAKISDIGQYFIIPIAHFHPGHSKALSADKAQRLLQCQKNIEMYESIGSPITHGSDNDKVHWSKRVLFAVDWTGYGNNSYIYRSIHRCVLDDAGQPLRRTAESLFDLIGAGCAKKVRRSVKKRNAGKLPAFLDQRLLSALEQIVPKSKIVH